MLPELGQIALILALLVAILQAVLPLAGAHRGKAAWMDVARPAAYAQLWLVMLAFIALTVAFVKQDFSVKYVADNSNSLLPMVYRYTAVWGSHEGSLLLWALVLALWTGAVALWSKRLPDDVIAAEKPCLQQMIEAYEETGGNIIGVEEVDPAETQSYGIVARGEGPDSGFAITGMVEKPKAADAPSNLAVNGRYILQPQVLTNLNKRKQGAGGEIQLTDAIAEETKSGKVYGYRFRGQRYDCGSKAGFLQATVAFGLSRPDLRDEFSAYLHDMIALQKAAQ